MEDFKNYFLYVHFTGDPYHVLSYLYNLTLVNAVRDGEMQM